MDQESVNFVEGGESVLGGRLWWWWGKGRRGKRGLVPAGEDSH